MLTQGDHQEYKRTLFIFNIYNTSQLCHSKHFNELVPIKIIPRLNKNLISYKLENIVLIIKVNLVKIMNNK